MTQILDIAPGILGTTDANNSVRMMTMTPAGEWKCLKCDGTVDTSQQYINFHDDCLRCPTCGSEMLVTYRDGPAETWCRQCAMREENEAQERIRAASEAKYEAARTLLIDGGGTTEERAAAVEVIQDYYWELAS